jgi:hypothetical protein
MFFVGLSFVVFLPPTLFICLQQVIFVENWPKTNGLKKKGTQNS